ncbi:hypothetical protein ACFQ1E_03775 [Sphingomonas canadensis]|uniref:Uncharacterized protein n=1 Tax=Sphingomonas canadensis TaxID=1219257 RepID=A0ABW3H3K3_9SPHN|nr:hypothetical protein [Sphingomonas canadensis]MCW3834638.1 hypothetical protein [Sphingomonas canadensis]
MIGRIALTVLALCLAIPAAAQEAAHPAEGVVPPVFRGLGLPGIQPNRTTPTPTPRANNSKLYYPAIDDSWAAGDCLSMPSPERVANKCDYEVIFVYCILGLDCDKSILWVQSVFGGQNTQVINGGRMTVLWAACRMPAGPVDVSFANGRLTGHCTSGTEPPNAPGRALPRAFPLTAARLEAAWPSYRAQCPLGRHQSVESFVPSLTGKPRGFAYRSKRYSEVTRRYRNGPMPDLDTCTADFLLALGS